MHRARSARRLSVVVFIVLFAAMSPALAVTPTPSEPPRFLPRTDSGSIEPTPTAGASPTFSPAVTPTSKASKSTLVPLVAGGAAVLLLGGAVVVIRRKKPRRRSEQQREVDSHARCVAEWTTAWHSMTSQQREVAGGLRDSLSGASLAWDDLFAALERARETFAPLDPSLDPDEDDELQVVRRLLAGISGSVGEP